MFLFLLLFSGCIFSMERNDSLAIVHNSASAAAAASPDSSSSSNSIDLFASPEEREELYARALNSFYPGYEDINERLKCYLDRIIIQPNNDVHESNISVLRRLRSGDIEQYHEQYIKRLVMRATSEAFKDQQTKLEEHENKIKRQKEKIDDKISKTSTALIALGASIVTSIASVLIAVYSQK